jgi:hypothetical protein
MRWERILLGTSIALTLPVAPVFAQAGFTCGSTGANGALSVAPGETVTLDVPDDGIFHFSTVAVSGTLQFNRNNAFNPPVIILASGDITIANTGSVTVSGASGTNLVGGVGGPGAFDGGAPGIAGSLPGAGLGPGAGGAALAGLPAGNAAYGRDPVYTDAATDGLPYGSPLLFPLAAGSGGGGTDNAGGGGGGGAVLFCSPTQIVLNGSVLAQGGTGSFGTQGNGSGGAIRFVSPAVRGTGYAYVYGANQYGGQGRIRVDLIDRTGLTMTFGPSDAVSVGSLMAVFPSTVPRLDIVSVAGNAIPPGTASPLAFTLPFNAPATQSITVRASGFTGPVPIAVVVTPDSGNPIVVNTEINADVPPAEATVTVNIPQNLTVRVNAWTR